MLAGEYYKASDEALTLERRKAQSLQYRINISTDPKGEECKAMLAQLLPNCSRNIIIRPPFYVDYGSNITCGDKCYFNYDCILLDVAPITIGRNCLFAPRVQLLTATHPVEADLRREDLEYGAPIRIGDDCWLGGGVIVCPGVTIGDRVVIGAGSVVTKDIPSDSVAVGNPARVIRKLDRKPGKD